MTGRILVLLGDSFQASGGIAQFNRDLISAWAEMDTIEEVVLVPRHASDSKNGLPRKVVQTAPVHHLFQYILGAIRTSFRRSPFDFIFCAHLNFVPLAFAVSRMLGIPMWLHLHGIEAWEKPSRVVRWSAEGSTLITSVSRHTRRMFLRWVNLAPQIVHILPNTFGRQFNPVGERSSSIEKYGLAGKKVLLTVSRLSSQDDYKGHNKVIRCLPELCSEFDDLVYAIGGEGDLRKGLQKLAESLQVSHAVKFLGPIKHDELPSLYRGADVFVMPSTGEGFGIVYLESIACGTPVIAGNGDGARDPLQDGSLGVLVTEEELRESIREILKTKDPSMHTGTLDAQRAKSVVRFFGRPTFLSNVHAITEGLQRNCRTSEVTGAVLPRAQQFGPKI